MLNFKQFLLSRPLANGILGVMVVFMSRWLKRTVAVLITLLGVFCIGSNLWVWSAGWGRLARSPVEVPVGSVMVLLGTNEFDESTGQSSGTFRPRIDAAVELARSGRVKLIVTSGTDIHARSMATQLRAAGVTCPIVEDPFGWRTLDSVLRAKAYYPNEHIVFVSQGWHCTRALWLADYEKLGATAYPASFGEGWRVYQSWVRDCFAKPKAVLDRIAGNPLTSSMPANQGNLPHP